MERKAFECISLSVYLGFLVLFSFGCADPGIKPAIPINQGQGQQLLQNSVSLMVLVPEKRIEFAEKLNRGLWMEMKENYYSFDSIWDPAPFLEDNATRILQTNFNLKILPLRKNIEPSIYRDL